MNNDKLLSALSDKIGVSKDKIKSVQIDTNPNDPEKLDKVVIKLGMSPLELLGITEDSYK